MRKKQDMLNQGNKIIKLLFIILVINSCNDKEIVNYEQFSRNIIGDVFYNQFSKQVNDSINLWCNGNLESYQFLCMDKWELDKTICFNKEKDKCVMSLNIQCTRNKCKAEDMHFFYGVKIKDSWYFFTGATIYLPREMYQKDVTKPLSFEKLHEIALKEVFSGYLKKKKPIVPFWKFWVKQEYEVDESYFDKHFRGQGWGGGDWIEDPDGSNGHWNGRIYTDEEFNKMYKEKALSVWPSSNPLTSFYDINIKRWRNIHQDSFDILLKAKKINPNGTAVE